MSHTLLQLDVPTLNLVLAEIGAKIADLTQGSQIATQHFEVIIGSDGHPDISDDERVSRLKHVAAELGNVLAHIKSEEAGGAMKPLSEPSILVLEVYAEQAEPARFDGPHVYVGKGVPSIALMKAAIIARGHMAKLMVALNDEYLPQPEVTFDAFFMDYEEMMDEEGIEIDDDLWICDTVCGYLTQIIENPDLAWKDGIPIPECVNDHVLQPALRAMRNAPVH